MSVPGGENRLIVYLVLYNFTVVNFKKGPAITYSASYSLGSCPLAIIIAVPGNSTFDFNTIRDVSVSGVRVFQYSGLYMQHVLTIIQDKIPNLIEALG